MTQSVFCSIELLWQFKLSNLIQNSRFHGKNALRIEIELEFFYLLWNFKYNFVMKCSH